MPFEIKTQDRPAGISPEIRDDDGDFLVERTILGDTSRPENILLIQGQERGETIQNLIEAIKTLSQEGEQNLPEEVKVKKRDVLRALSERLMRILS